MTSKEIKFRQYAERNPKVKPAWGCFLFAKANGFKGAPKDFYTQYPTYESLLAKPIVKPAVKPNIDMAQLQSMLNSLGLKVVQQ